MNTNEQAPDSCPFCGAGKKRHLPHIAFRWFECGTMTRADNNRRDQTPACATAEIARLTRERDEAMAERDAEKERADGNLDAFQKMLIMKDAVRTGLGLCLQEKSDLLARVKRLEEAGDAILWYFRPKDTGDISFLQSEAMKQWAAAKEAKP